MKYYHARARMKTSVRQNEKSVENPEIDPDPYIGCVINAAFQIHGLYQFDSQSVALRKMYRRKRRGKK